MYLLDKKMSKEEYISQIKLTVNSNKVVTQNQLAKHMLDKKWFSLRETYYVMKELIDFKQIKYIQDESGRYTFYA